jgi:RNA polymerase sigma factor (sigma-70 family)
MAERDRARRGGSGSAPAGLSPAARAVLADNHDRFLAFVRQRVRSPDLAEEILHDALVRGLAHGGALRDDGAVTAWFYRLLRNAIVDHVRSEAGRRRGLSALERELASAAGATPEADQQALVDTICRCVNVLLGALRAEYARALERVDLGGEPIDSFARQAGITRVNASVRLHRARRALRREIGRSCGSCAEHGCYQCECRGAPHRSGL